MGKSGAVHATELDRLRDEFLDMKAAVRKVSNQVEAEYRERIEEEIDYRTRTLKRTFAVRLVELKELGATRKELVKVIGDGTAEAMRELIELGGGSVKKHLTGSERAEERRKDMGVEPVSGNRYIWTVEGVEYESDLLWERGKPYLFPVGDGVVTLRDEHGFGPAEFRAKGVEVAAAFDVTETP